MSIVFDEVVAETAESTQTPAPAGDRPQRESEQGGWENEERRLQSLWARCSRRADRLSAE